MATAELAVAIPALVVVLALALSAVRMGIDAVRAVDAAHLAARIVARGEPAGTARASALEHVPLGSVVVIETGAGRVRVRIVPPAPPMVAAMGIHPRTAIAHARMEAEPPPRAS